VVVNVLDRLDEQHAAERRLQRRWPSRCRAVWGGERGIGLVALGVDRDDFRRRDRRTATDSACRTAIDQESWELSAIQVVRSLRADLPPGW
jgi:hypothetical protein